MKWSAYNAFFPDKNGNFLLYNTLSGSLTRMVKDLKKLVLENINSVDNLCLIHPELYEYLVKKKNIVALSKNEYKSALRKKKKELSGSSNHFGIIINPTMDCNLRCWYCYETHNHDSYMSLTTMEALKRLIEAKIQKVNIKFFTLSFFGGEPLMAFDRIVLPLIKYTQNLCQLNETQLNITFTSNCVLLNSRIVDILIATGLNIYIQVPFDGNREFHDKTKKFIDGKGTYDKVIKNIKYAFDKNIDFLIRCNYTSENVESFKDLVMEFKGYPKERLSFSFHLVWQVSEDKETFEKLRHVEELLSINKGDNFADDVRSLIPCYADSENDVVVNFNGDIYNCTARDFKPEAREGVLASDGNILYNEKHFDRMKIRYSHKPCRKCIVYPICNVCSQKKLEKPGMVCLRGLDEERKLKFIYAKVQMIAKEEFLN